HRVCAVLTAPDKPSGRGRSLSSSPVKLQAIELQLPVLQPEKIDQNFLHTVESLNPDILVVAAYSKIFRKSFLDLFPMGGINLHPSLLPKYRGPSPLQATILSGDREGGVTIQKLALQMDAGDILVQERIPLKGDETSGELASIASRIGARLLIDILETYRDGVPQGIPQREEQASYCHLLRKEDGLINWEEDAGKISRMIRAYLPWPRAYTLYRSRELYLLKGGVIPRNGNQGEIISDTLAQPDHPPKPGVVMGIDKRYGILIHTGRGYLYVEELQLKSKKSMNWRSFLNGQRDILGCRLGG
ncbi:MAG TPA: methionyl-tRNA formyltransferase, partial [Spirochaetia bacterium]|nr:methionyl-tRNA formyltransferase [Spirochaetia bacterium]